MAGSASRPAQTHPDLLAVGLRRTPDAVCVVDPVLRLTFAQVDERASRLLGALRAAGT
jgi:non-ribosomal peptide synthetase component F